jgi:hypothetical protein
VSEFEKQFVILPLLNLRNYLYFSPKSERQSHIYPAIKAIVDYQVNTSLGGF